MIKHSMERKAQEGAKEEMDDEINIQGAKIKAEQLTIGEGVIFGDRVTISSFHGEPAKRIIIGDHTYIGPDVNIACPELILGDVVTVHRRTGIFGEGACIIGHNSWIGQDCIEKLGSPYKPLSIEEKKEMLEDFLRQFLMSHPSLNYSMSEGRLSLFKEGIGKVGDFDFFQKRYKKQRTPEETAFIKFMKGNKARFIPEEEPVLGEKVRERIQEKRRGMC